MGSCNKVLRTSHSLKVPYTSRTSYRVPNLVFSRGGGGGGAYPNFNLRGANLKRGAYLKLGANSSFYDFCALPLFYSQDFGNGIKLRMDRCAFFAPSKSSDWKHSLSFL